MTLAASVDGAGTAGITGADTRIRAPAIASSPMKAS